MAYKRSNRLSLDVEYAQRSYNTGVIFENALKKMDSVLGIGVAETSTFGHETTGFKIASLCKQLHDQVVNSHHHPNGTTTSTTGPDPRLDIPMDTRDFLITWLSGDPRGSSFSSQLQADRETLLQQVQTLEKNLDLCRTENDNLKKELYKFTGPAGSKLPSHNRSNSGSNTLPVGSYSESSLSRGQTGRTSSLTAINPGASAKSNSSNFKRNKGLRDSFRKAFSRKGNSTSNISDNSDNITKFINSRAQAFHALSGTELSSWMASIDLEMYGDLISQLVVTGERLASIASSTDDLMRLGVLNILHCKKLKLAVEDAVAEAPSCLSFLNHQWVADWLTDVGLPQYQQSFIDAKIDGRMLNRLSMEDLSFLKIEHPFHITSLKRAIQAFRMCGYDSNYLKMRPDRGSLKLLQWSTAHIIDWMRDVDLDEFADKLNGTGLSGPVIALEPTLTHESLAKVVGIGPNKGLIIAHLGEKFLELIGPVCAQHKVDAMQMKNFAPLNPLEQPPKNKSRKSAKRSKSQMVEETLLIPLSENPPVVIKSSSSNNNTNDFITLRNLTISSDTGVINRRSHLHTPSPTEDIPNCPTPPLTTHSSNKATISVVSEMPPPPPPPPPPPGPPILK